VLGYWVLVKVNFCLGIFILSWAFQQIGWVQHEGGHRSLTGNVMIDGAIQYFIYYIVYGGSGHFWNYQHNHHHANTQHEIYDIDLKTLPLIAFDSEILPDVITTSTEKEGTKTKENNQSKTKAVSWWIRHQWFTYIFSNLMVYFLWRGLIHFRFELRKGNYWYIFITLVLSHSLHLFILMYFCEFNFKWAAIAGIAYSAGGVWLLLFHFSVSHTFTGTQNDNYNWVETAALHTVNVSDHWLVNIVMGLLNFQIEHHLFPQMSHANARRAVPYVKELFKKYDLPYYECGFFEGFFLVFKNLYHVGHGLPDVRPTGIDKNKKAL
jgi:fatty acid desaturase